MEKQNAYQLVESILNCTFYNGTSVITSKTFSGTNCIYQNTKDYVVIKINKTCRILDRDTVRS